MNGARRGYIIHDPIPISNHVLIRNNMIVGTCQREPSDAPISPPWPSLKTFDFCGTPVEYNTIQDMDVADAVGWVKGEPATGVFVDWTANPGHGPRPVIDGSAAHPYPTIAEALYPPQTFDWANAWIVLNEAGLMISAALIIGLLTRRSR